MLWSKALGGTSSIEYRGVFAGGGTGATPPTSSVIDYINISSIGNATDFGDLAFATYALAGVSNGSRGVFGGGIVLTPAGGGFYTPTSLAYMQYITIATPGNAATFGNLSQARTSLSGVSNSTRGVFGGGLVYSGSTTYVGTLDYITIATTGNATNFGGFGVLTLNRAYLAGVSSETRGVFGGGFNGFSNSVIDYISMASTVGAASFGALTTARATGGAVSNGSRGVFNGGSILDYITIATTGNATSFGSLSVSRGRTAGVSSPVRGVFGGGTASDVMDYINIATTGNATYFGNLTLARSELAGVSGT